MTQSTPANVFAPLPAPQQADLAQRGQHVFTLYQQGRLQEAELAARDLTQRAPQHGFGWKALGMILSRLDRKNEALPAMQQAAKLLPQDAEAFNNLGVLFREANELKFAQACYEHATKVNPSFLPALDNLIRLLTHMKQQQDLPPLLRRKLALVPGDESARQQLAELERDSPVPSA